MYLLDAFHMGCQVGSLDFEGLIFVEQAGLYTLEIDVMKRIFRNSEPTYLPHILFRPASLVLHRLLCLLTP